MGKKKSEERKTIEKKLRQDALTQIRPITLGALAMVVSTLSNQAVPRLLGKLLDQKATGSIDRTCSTTSSSSSSSSSSGIIGGLAPSTVMSLALVVLGGGIASFLRTTCLNRAQDSIAAQLRCRAFQSLMMRHDLEWFTTEKVRQESDDSTKEEQQQQQQQKQKQKNDGKDLIAPTGMTPGAIGSILNEDVATVAHMVTGNVANLIRSSCSCLFGTYHMLNLNPTLFALSFGVVPLIGTAAMVLRKFIKKVSEQQRETAMLAAAFAEERLTHIAMVKMSNRESEEVEQFHKLQDECVMLGQNVSLANGIFMGFIFAASSGALFVVFHTGGKAVAAGLMTAGDLTSFATYTFLLGLGTSGIIKAMTEMTQGMVSAQRLYRLIGDETSKPEEQKNSKMTETVDMESISSISLDNVVFAYKSNPEHNILSGVSMKLNRGKVVCIVGKNGSGKTTIASLLASLYKPQSGRILLSDGTNYNDLDRQTQKKLVQVVPQNPSLFNTTILENIRYSNPSASQEDILEAMQLANCDFVNELPDGLDHLVGPNGDTLSGGQRQRLGLARALLSDPCILVLDEPSSAMDFEGETAVADAVKACRSTDRPGRALLLITHRAKSLELADEIVVLKAGTIVEHGTFDTLKNTQESELCQLMPHLLDR